MPSWTGWISGRAGLLALLEASCLGPAGCGGDFSERDAKVAADSVLTAGYVQTLCARGGEGRDGGTEAGPCTPSEVRASTRELLCGAESLLVEHGKPVPDAGAVANTIVCAPVKRE